MNPLTITNSPCAKFTTSVALKIRTKPSAMSAYTQPVASPLTTWLVRISTMRRAAPRLLAPADFLELHPLARLRPLTVLHDDEPARVAHAAAIVAAVRVLQAPARIPVLDRLDRPEHRVAGERSEEHTSELQSPCNLVCRLLLEKKKKIKGCGVQQSATDLFI